VAETASFSCWQFESVHGYGLAVKNGGVSELDQRECELSVIILALNEGTSVGELVRRVRKHLEALARTFEILVVDGGLTDGTPRWAAGRRDRGRTTRARLR
jgi:hypothetical protein